MGDRIRITDVAPRDGLQNERGIVPTSEKARLIEAIARTGVDEVEVTSFVSPKWIPQLGDAAEVCGLIAPTKPEGVVYSALVPNEKGMERLLEVNAAAERGLGRRVIDKVSVFTAASETFSRRNTNASIQESITRFDPVVRMSRESKLALRGYVSCAIACPFEGPIEPEAVSEVAFRLADLGIEEIDIGDTIGAGTRDSTRRMLEAVLAKWAGERVDGSTLTLHLHDTFGRAGECVRAGLEIGIRSFDGSVAGIGGCPYASTPGNPAPGNVATELLVQIAEREGYATKVDHRLIEDASGVAQTIIASASARGGSA